MIGIDKPEISLFLIQTAFANFLREETGVEYVYTNPNIQNNKLPCWHINFIPPATMTPSSVNNRHFRNLGMDLVYMVQFDDVNLFDKYLAMAELLDEKLELLAFPYTFQEDEEAEPETRYAYLRIYDRDWNAGLDVLHYRFELNLRVSRSRDPNVKMRIIEELNEYIKEVTADGTEVWYKWH